MNAATYIPEERMGWWGGLDTRRRCLIDDKVAFESREDAEDSASNIRSRGDSTMMAYKGKCGNWHVGHSNLNNKQI